jgi:aminopeptidase-like protein
MAPQKMIKVAGEGANTNADILSDTTPRAIDMVKSWTQVFEILEHDLINCLEDSDDEVNKTHATKLMDIAQSELHKIAVRPRLMPYNDMIGWALENVDIQTMSVFNSQKVFVGSF